MPVSSLMFTLFFHFPEAFVWNDSTKSLKKKKHTHNEKRPTSLSCLHGKEWVSWARAWLRTDTRSGTRVTAKPRCARRAWPRGAPSGPALFAPPRSGLPSSDADHTDVSSSRFLLLLFFNGNVKQRHFPLLSFFHVLIFAQTDYHTL